LIVGDRAAFGNGLLATRNAFQHRHARQQRLIGFHIDEIRAGQPMLGDEDGLPIAFDIGQQVSGLPLEGGDELGAHEVTLQYHSRILQAVIPDADSMSLGRM